MKKSRGTEIKLDELSSVNVVFGTIDKNNPKTIYVRITAWANPINYEDDLNYNSIIGKIDKRVRTTLFNELDGKVFSKTDYLTDTDMRESGISKGKSSFISCEITLYQINHFLITSQLVDDELNKLSTKVIKNGFLENEYFKFYHNKKNAKLKLKESLII